MTNIDRYEGHVIQVKDDSFIARLRDVDDRTARGLEAEIDFRELRPLQQARVLPGAYFTWTISYDMRNQMKASWFDFPEV